MKNKTTAALFALLLGGLGIHKFYLGKPGIGILYILFCWTIIPSIIGFVEGLMFFSMSDDDFDRKYNPDYLQLISEQDKLRKENIKSSKADELKTLFELKEKGGITEEEYQEKKNELL
jgi:TM2 domain-containing membrane protein YozV